MQRRIDTEWLQVAFADRGGAIACSGQYIGEAVCIQRQKTAIIAKSVRGRVPSVMKDARLGMQTGDVAWKLANLVPCAASASIFGVLTIGCPAQLIQSLRNWSVIMNRKFGRVCDVILRPLGHSPEGYYLSLIHI